MPSVPPFAPIAAALPATIPFVGPEEIERRTGVRLRARLGANELTRPPSPAVAEAMERAARDEANLYPDAPAHALREAIAAATGHAYDGIAPGEGIDALLGLTVRLFLAPGEVAVTSDGAYPTFGYHVAGHGGRLVSVPYRDDREDWRALAEAARARDARIVYLSNPDNPMGSWLDAAEIEAFVDAVPEGCAIILDEAYAEFAPPGSVPPVTLARPNLLRMRTFSKLHGLAGLRVGYALCDAQVRAGFDRIRNHFGVNRIAQAAARAALGDAEGVAATLDAMAAGRARLVRIAESNRLVPLPSATNFVTMEVGGDGALGRAVVEGLAREGVFIRMPSPAPLNRCIRIGIGRDDELDLLEAVLPGVLAAVRG